MNDFCCISSEAEYSSAPELFYDKIVKARKKHFCIECRGIILPKSEYERISCKWDGEFLIYRTCLTCKELRDKLYCNGAGAYSELWQDIADTDSGCFGSRVGELSDAAKLKLGEFLEIQEDSKKCLGM